MFFITRSDSSGLPVFTDVTPGCADRPSNDSTRHGRAWTTVGLIASADSSSWWVPRPGFVGAPRHARVRSRSDPGQTTSAALASPSSHMFYLLIIYTVPFIQDVSLVVVPGFVLPFLHWSSSVSPPFSSGNCLSKCLKAYVPSFIPKPSNSTNNRFALLSQYSAAIASNPVCHPNTFPLTSNIYPSSVNPFTVGRFELTVHFSSFTVHRRFVRMYRRWSLRSGHFVHVRRAL